MVEQKGFTLLELMISLVLIGTFSVFGLSSYNAMMFDGKVEQMEREISILLRELELARSSEATTVIVGGVYNRTYKTLAAGSSVSDLETLSGRQVVVNNINPFDFAYSLEITDKISYVRATLPGVVQYPWAPTSTVAGNTVVEYSSILANATNSLPSATASIQKALFLEGTRH